MASLPLSSSSHVCDISKVAAYWVQREQQTFYPRGREITVWFGLNTRWDFVKTEQTTVKTWIVVF
jgi:hypothetical protein